MTTIKSNRMGGAGNPKKNVKLGQNGQEEEESYSGGVPRRLKTWKAR